MLRGIYQRSGLGVCSALEKKPTFLLSIRRQRRGIIVAEAPIRLSVAQQRGGRFFGESATSVAAVSSVAGLWSVLASMEISRVVTRVRCLSSSSGQIRLRGSSSLEEESYVCRVARLQTRSGSVARLCSEGILRTLRCLLQARSGSVARLLPRRI